MDAQGTMSADEATALRRDLERLKSDLRQIRTDLGGLTEDAVRAAKTGAAQAKDKIDEKLHAAADRGREAAQAVEVQVAAHPFVSLATAFAVGMVLGMGLSRKD